MVDRMSNIDEVNVLASVAGWAWPSALQDIFKPRGVNLMVAQDSNEFVDIIEQRRIHTAIVDMDNENSNGLATIKLIRFDYPRLPCIMLKDKADDNVLVRALELDVFGVINKPVDMNILRGLLHRLFLKRYNSDIFA